NKLDYPSDFDFNCNPYFDHIGKYDAYSGAIVKLKYVKNFPIHVCNAGQAIYAEALMDPDIAAVVCVGPAGSGKTYMATVYGYSACKNGEFIGVTVVPCDSRSKLGALPGDLDEKMDPDVQPLKNALRNYLLKEDSKLRKELETLKKFGAYDKKNKSQDCDEESPERKSLKVRLKSRVDLIWDNWFSNIPIESAGGRDFSYELAIYDEFQDQTVSQADTLIKRLGTDGKIIITGDIEQIHAPYIDHTSTGLTYASRQLMDSPMVAQVCFTEDEVIRHPLVKMIAIRQKKRRAAKKA
ncbi:PhoH family protein, partial [Candidatus Saccharibacteria bacterium]|nr:PhoH family protein [Candidatus Saccharibacteria bacterium]